MTAVAHRSEHDLLGYRDVPAEAYWGIHTLRARENFAITGTPIPAYPYLIEALAAVKEAAARPVRRRRDPGRCGHLDQHERQRASATRRPPASPGRPSPPDAESPNSSWTRAFCLPAPSPSCSVPKSSRDPVKCWCDVIERYLA